MTYQQALAAVSKVSVPAELRIKSRKIDFEEAYADVAGAVKNQEEPEDKFYAEELTLAALLLMWWQNTVERLNVADILTAAAQSNVPNDIYTELDDFADPLSAIVTDEKESQVDEVLLLTALIGAGIVNFTDAVSDSPIAKAILLGYRQQIKYYTNQYFLRIVSPAIRAAVLKNVSSFGNTINLAESIQTALRNGVLDTATYWRLTANGSVGRAHHYGLLRASRERGLYAYRYTAVMDHRTTPLCRNLNGRVFHVSQGIQKLEQIAEAPAQDLALVAPWLTLADVEGKTDAELEAEGVLVPPMHVLCRSYLVPLYN